VPDIRELVLGLEGWLALTVVTGLPLGGYWFVRLRGQRLLPPQRSRLVPWSGFEIFLILFLNEFFFPGLVYEFLHRSHFFVWLYGTDLTFGEDAVANARLGLWLTAISFTLQLPTLLAVLNILSGTRPYQLGLTVSRVGRNTVVGWLGWFILTPTVLALNYLVAVLATWLQEPPEKHPVMQIVEACPLPVEWWVILLATLVVAPVMEELFYRGILQPWFAARSWGAHLAMIISFFLALYPWLSPLFDKKAPGFTLHALEPVIFVLLTVPCYMLAPTLARRWIPSTLDTRAIFGTSLLFAMRHAHVWPTPVPLLLLALGLGYVTYRTRSLVPSILWHSLFNAVNFVQLVLL